MLLKYLFNFVLIINVSICATVDIVSVGVPEEVCVFLKSYEHKLDAYGNLRIEIKADSNSLFDDLNKIKGILSEKWSKRAIYIHIPISLGRLGGRMADLGFELYDIDKDSKHLIYLFKNGRGIPNISNAFVTASVFIYRNNPETRKKELLIVNEYDKKDLTVPAGCGDDVELAIDTVVREVKEEVGIDLSREKLKLFSVRNRTFKATKKNQVDFCFVATIEPETAVQVDGDEVLSYTWAPVEKVVQSDFKAHEKIFSPLYVDSLKDKTPIGVVRQIGEGHTLTRVTDLSGF